MKKTGLVLLIILCLGASGCASKYMQPADPAKTAAAVAKDEAAIVFFRSTSFGGAIQAPVVEVVDGQVRFVGIVSAGMKIQHKTTPGQKYFVVGGESGELMEADLEGGKTYYCYVVPRFGLWKARFGFEPVALEKISSSEFAKDFNWCSWHENAPEAISWFSANQASMQSKYAEALKEHREAKPEDRKVMRPEYGVLMPVQ